MADFHHQPATRLEMVRRCGNDAPHEVEAVAAARECQTRLAPILPGQPGHRLRGDVGRIGEDQVVTAPFQPVEEIGPYEPHASGQPVVPDVAAGDRERFRREVRGVESGAREAVGGDDRETAGPGAQIEHGAHGARRGEPRAQPVREQFGDEGPRHDHPLVHVKAEFAEPGDTGEIGRRLARTDALRHEAGHRRVARRVHRHGPVGGIERQSECVEREPCGLVPRIGGAVAVGDAGGLQRAGRTADERAQGERAGGSRRPQGHVSRCAGDR